MSRGRLNTSVPTLNIDISNNKNDFVFKITDTLQISGLVSRYQFCKNAVLGETSYFSIRFPWPIFCI